MENISNNQNEEKKELTKQEKNKEYQKIYYKINKTKLLKNMCAKCECLLCGRVVIKNNINSHQKSNICKRNSGRTKTYIEL